MLRTPKILRASSGIIAAPAILMLATPAFANSLTNLIPTLYEAMDIVSRELVGMIPSVTRNTAAERAAVGENVVYPISAQKGTFNVTPAMTPPEPSDTNTGNASITITKSKGVEFGWTGEEQRGLNNGVGYNTIQRDNIAQGLRTLVNEMEVDLCVVGAANASRAWGTAGTTPFATNLQDAAGIRKILDDNGAPASERSLIIDTTAGMNMRTLTQLTKVNEAGTAMTLRDGQLLDLFGLSVKESAGVQFITAGTAAGATTTAAVYAKGATLINLASAGTGTIPAGSSITFAGDTNKYTVVAGDTDVSNGGTITLAEPGLRVATSGSATAITMVASHVANLGFSRNAIHLVARAPALPVEGDAASERIMITDPRSGMTFEIAIYRGYRKIRAEIVAAWGVGAIKREHIAMLLG